MSQISLLSIFYFFSPHFVLIPYPFPFLPLYYPHISCIISLLNCIWIKFSSLYVSSTIQLSCCQQSIGTAAVPPGPGWSTPRDTERRQLLQLTRSFTTARSVYSWLCYSVLRSALLLLFFSYLKVISIIHRERMQGHSLCEFLLYLLYWKLKSHSLIHDCVNLKLERHNGKSVVFLTI